MIRGGNIGPTRWASPTRLKLGSDWAIKLLAKKNWAKFGPARPGQPEFFFALKILFGPTGPVFRVGWAVKILQGFQTRSGVLTRGGERVKGSEVQPGRTGVQPDR